MTAIAVPQSPAALAAREYFSPDQIALIKRTICRDATDDEMALFLYQCKRTGLDPFEKQIYFRKYRGKDGKPDTITIITGIDGYRLMAERTEKCQGQLGPFWCGPEGQWTDVWLKADPPAAAKVGVWKEGCKEPYWGVAKWTEFFPQNANEQFMWRRMPSNQLAKCAEALALRKAFPKELSGIYADAEMAQAEPAVDVLPAAARVEAKPAPRPAIEADEAKPEKTEKTPPPKPAPVDDPVRLNLIQRLREGMLKKAPEGLGMDPNHAENWLVKFFGQKRPTSLTNDQLTDANLLIMVRIKTPELYPSKLEQFASEGRILTAEHK